MEYWLTKAIEYLPDLEDLITEPQPLRGPMGLCSDLYFELVSAYDVSPMNEDRIGRLYDFIGWCLTQPSADSVETDVPTAAVIGFIENLPLDQRVSEDLHRWMSVETFNGMEKIFRYHLSEEEYRKFARHFLEMKKRSTSSSRL